MLIMLDSAINILNFVIIVYSFEVSIARVTFLHFVELVYMMFLVKVNFAISFDLVLITSTNLIWELRFLLLAKDSLTKT